MINETLERMGRQPSIIRQIYLYGLERKAKIGAKNVFDFSLGNPSVPAPRAVGEAIVSLTQDMDPCALHGYTRSAGDAAVQQAVADSIRRRFGFTATADQIYMTCGAAASLCISFAAVSHEGDEIIVISPHFPEYSVWISWLLCTCVEVPALPRTFQLDLDAIEDAITPKTAAIVLNSPNNPTGAVYPRESLERLALLLMRKNEEYGHPIYIISDEPYREITYGAEVPYIPEIYSHTLVCYSWSKSFSLPGERIGYVYASDTMPEAERVIKAVSGAGRALGYVNAPSLFQRVIQRCIDEPSDVQAYARNRELLTGIMDRCGYEYVQPDGAFYLWVKALEPNANAFAERAKELELLVVPSDSFGVTGWVRLGYCVDADTIRNSEPAWKKLAESYK